MTDRVLVVGLGHPDRGDDGVGGVVVQRLAHRPPPGVVLCERHGDMLGLIDLWAGFDAVICVDASSPAGRPGNIRRLDLAIDELPPQLSPVSSHAFGFADTVALARALRLLPRRTIVFAVEGVGFDAGAQLTAAVSEAADAAAELVAQEVGTLADLAGAEPDLPR